VIVLGLHHRSVPLELLERMTVGHERVPKALHDLTSREHLSEAVVLSTCNRVEVYVSAERFHGAVADVRNFLAESAGLAPEAFADHLYTYHDAGAAAHLFTVAAGLDSVVLGESEILGQVRAAWERAAAEGATGPSLNVLFRHAVEVGKRVRTETRIARSITSVAQAAVRLAAERLGSLAGRRVLVLGAGDMGEGLAIALGGAGVGEVEVANRSPERARELAAKVGGTSLSFAELGQALGRVDVLLTSTGSSSTTVGLADLEEAHRRRGGRPLLILDVAVPRDVDPGVATLPGVTLLDMNDLKAFSEAGLAERRREVGRVRDLIDEEVSRWHEAVTARHVAPLIAALRARVEDVRVAELERLGRNLPPDEAARLDALSRSLTAKLLHDPTVRLRQASGSARGERLAEATRELFDV
jgi:glutamyl-tRNA reductase